MPFLLRYDLSLTQNFYDNIMEHAYDKTFLSFTYLLQQTETYLPVVQ
jgi:hypothetical protein